MASLTGATIASTYLTLLRLSSATIGANDSAKYIHDAADTASALSISTTRVGIGTAAPSQDLHIYKAGGGQINLETSEETIEANDLLGAINFLGLDTASGNWVTHAVGASIQVKADGTWGDTNDASDAPTRMEFFTESNTDDDGMGNVRMCIDSTGYVGIGTHTPSTSLEVTNPAAAATIVTINSSADGQDSIIKLRENSYDRWSIKHNASDDRLYILDAGGDDGLYLAQDVASTPAWLDASDERIKTSLTPIENAVDKLNTLQAVNFKWKYGTEKRKARNNIGLLAQDVQRVIPDAVDVPKGDFELIDHPIVDGEKKPENAWGVAYSRIVPVLIKAIQELSAKVEVLENA